MDCKYCIGHEPIFYHDKYDCAFIDEDGTMRVSVNGAETRFQVDRCPKCGRLFKGVNYLNLRQGDDIWYADEEEGIVEHGTIHSIHICNNDVKVFSVNFDNGDFDEFDGSGLGTHFFMHQIDAEEALVHI